MRERIRADAILRPVGSSQRRQGLKRPENETRAADVEYCVVVNRALNRALTVQD